MRKHETLHMHWMNLNLCMFEDTISLGTGQQMSTLDAMNAYTGQLLCNNYTPGPGCSKLTMSLVNDSLKFTSSDTQIC